MSKRQAPKAAGYHWDVKERLVLPCGSKACRMCKRPITAKRRQTFCSEPCVHEWQRRTCPEVFRADAEKADKGTCRACGLVIATIDCDALRYAYWNLPEAARPAAMTAILAATEYQTLNRIGGHLFEIDHIVPIVEGGDWFDPDNLRLLCIPCHRVETAALAAKRAQARRSRLA
jgi:5-methylcytosine-specific restriction protein A